MTVKSQSSIVNSRDLQALTQLACKLIGATCWRVNFSYGDELMLHFGDRVPYSQASMSGQPLTPSIHPQSRNLKPRTKLRTFRSQPQLMLMTSIYTF
ncbi:hypothetical protein [Chamaesiphon sp. GL140_3_metabinner_50]|uniref:hypothetical protein n=1 Tax=Chamaesiphon sp. GL140_3_metabinner_50 TaxID=2970812 RepID=UPI002600C6A4|nr:hypothetical protein [Chamaesiphon sp. GL140_3_metabinner_50]